MTLLHRGEVGLDEQRKRSRRARCRRRAVMVEAAQELEAATTGTTCLAGCVYRLGVALVHPLAAVMGQSV